MKAHLTKVSLALLSAAFLFGCQEQGSESIGPESLAVVEGPSVVFSDDFESAAVGTLPSEYLLLSGTAEVTAAFQSDGTEGQVLLLGQLSTIEVVAAGELSHVRVAVDNYQGQILTFSRIYVRAQDVENGYYVEVENGTWLSLVRVVAGVETVLARARLVVPAAGHWRRITVEVVGQDLRVMEEDGLLMRAVDATFSTGRVLFTSAGGPTRWDNLVIELLTPEEQLQAILNEILADENLDSNVTGSLVSKLENVIAKLDKDNVGAAINQLQAFINQIQALIQAGTLAQPDGEILIDVAQGVIDQLTA